MSRWRVSKRRYAVSENEPSHCTKGPEWAGIRTFRKSPVAHDCVVVDAARIEPVSTSNSLLAGNLAGNFLKRGPPTTIPASKTRAASIAYERIPCSTEQGIFLLEQGIFSRKQGILLLDRSHPSRLGTMCVSLRLLIGFVLHRDFDQRPGLHASSGKSCDPIALLAEVPIAASLGGIRPIPAQVERR
jgi:hypothetical protein